MLIQKNKGRAILPCLFSSFEPLPKLGVESSELVIFLWYALATFVMHTLKSTIPSYFLNFFLPTPASPIKPEPKRSIVAGSGIGSTGGADDIAPTASISAPSYGYPL